MVEYVKSFNLELPVAFNYHGTPASSWPIGQRPVQHTSFNDYGSGEAYPDFWGVLYPSLATRFIRGANYPRDYEVITNRFNRAWDYTVKTVEQLKWEIFTILSNGGRAVVVDQPFHDGQIDDVVYERLNKVYGEVETKQDIFGGEPIKQVALYYSAKTRDWYAREHPSKYVLAFNGAYKSPLRLRS